MLQSDALVVQTAAASIPAPFAGQSSLPVNLLTVPEVVTHSKDSVLLIPTSISPPVSVSLPASCVSTSQVQQDICEPRCHPLPKPSQREESRTMGLTSPMSW